jgi:hypothetical protein
LAHPAEFFLIGVGFQTRAKYNDNHDRPFLTTRTLVGLRSQTLLNEPSILAVRGLEMRGAPWRQFRQGLSHADTPGIIVSVGAR